MARMLIICYPERNGSRFSLTASLVATVSTMRDPERNGSRFGRFGAAAVTNVGGGGGAAAACPERNGSRLAHIVPLRSCSYWEVGDGGVDGGETV